MSLQKTLYRWRKLYNIDCLVISWPLPAFDRIQELDVEGTKLICYGQTLNLRGNTFVQRENVNYDIIMNYDYNEHRTMYMIV